MPYVVISCEDVIILNPNAPQTIYMPQNRAKLDRWHKCLPNDSECLCRHLSQCMRAHAPSPGRLVEEAPR